MYDKYLATWLKLIFWAVAIVVTHQNWKKGATKIPYFSKFGLLKVLKLKPMLQTYVFTPHDLNYLGDGNTNLSRDILKHIVFVVNNVANKF
jgi:hypothetical protein